MNATIMAGHSGEIPGYNNSMYAQKEENGATIVVFTNRYSSEIEGVSDHIFIEIIRVFKDHGARARSSHQKNPLPYFFISPAEISFLVEKGVFWWFDYC